MRPSANDEQPWRCIASPRVQALSTVLGCAVTCGQSVRFTARSEAMGLSVGRQSRSIAAPITTPARSSSWVASPRQPVSGIVTNRATRWNCTTRLSSLIRGNNRPPWEVTLMVQLHRPQTTTSRTSPLTAAETSPLNSAAITPNSTGAHSFQVTVLRDGRRKPLVARFGGIPLKRQPTAVLTDLSPVMASVRRNELIHRLLAGRCEICAAQEDLEVHHIRKLADLNQTRPT
jgi:hypothetical protein